MNLVYEYYRRLSRLVSVCKYQASLLGRLQLHHANKDVAMVKASSTPRLPYRNVREQSPTGQAAVGSTASRFDTGMRSVIEFARG